jgi:diguanylate cyclase (GGDEF)-like protein
MDASLRPAARSKVFARIAVVGMFLAVLALGTLAVWSSIVTQNGAAGLSGAGVQTSGHLRAIQALSLINSSADGLEAGPNPVHLKKLRNAQKVLDDALYRMQNGEVRDAQLIAGESKPIVRRLKPAIEWFLTACVVKRVVGAPTVACVSPTTPPGFDSKANGGPEKLMEDTMRELEVVLNDLDSDPSQLLTTELASVTATERTVRATAFILIPLGLLGVAVCAWLLSGYRRRAEATMLATIAASATEARTDELTGLPNRRALLEELEARTDRNETFTLTIADLNGFKRYNDTFGHPAGDALLKRLGRKLATACEGHGTAARLGGDEFCVLLDGNVPPDEAHALLQDALGDEGEGFRITSSTGAVAVPKEAVTSSEALRLADTRMYAAKLNAYPGSDQWISGVLTRMLDERHPGLGGHVEEVANLAGTCAKALGLSPDDVRLVEKAAELHDLGKVGIPSEILTKPGILNDEEMEFVQSHSVIGERILAGAPSLEGVASMVRSSHERWDGTGYPDGLAGNEIPIGARIVFVVDSYCAMTEDRPYAQARSPVGARHELSACSGTQFDPTVVVAFLSVLNNRDIAARVPASLVA